MSHGAVLNLNVEEEDLPAELGRLIEIGIALSAETDLGALLEKIVKHAREVSGADAGTLYTVEANELRFRIFRNDTAERTGKRGLEPSELPPVPLDPRNVSACAALTGEELHRLSVRRGTLTEEEYAAMKEHVVRTSRMLAQIHFDGGLQRGPVFAGQHHERVNGKGYPARIHGDEIPLLSRILAVAALYEALSSSDRPYKKAMPTDQILGILRRAAESGEIDGGVVEVLIRHRVHEAFETAYREFRGELGRGPR